MMRGGEKLRVGILNPASAVGHGGYMQYLQALTEGLSHHDDLEVLVFFEDPRSIPDRSLATGVSWHALPENEGRLAKVLRAGATILNVPTNSVGRFRALEGHGLDCLVSCAAPVGFHLGISFVGIVFDFIYRYFPDLADFPLRERLARDLTNSRLVKHAALTVTDSDAGKRDLVRFFGADPERTRPIPLSPSPHTYAHRALPDSTLREVASRYELPERFVFYPAQLWEHKNHRRLFEALVHLREQHGVVVPCVLAGSGGAYADRVLDGIAELGLEKQVLHVGYVSDEDLCALYALATALVYASFAEYTNMPVLEAMVLETPVVCSNAFAMPEQIGDAGLMFDPFDVEDMACQIHQVWTDKPLRERLVRLGAERAENLSLDKFGKRWRDVIIEAAGARADGC
jgi:glycosyltransferase involved in cell wall biosynthesis